MAATWLPPWMSRYLNNNFTWRLVFVLWPVRSYESNQLIWFKRAWHGTRSIDGPAGESPLKAERWLTQEEYVWYNLKEQQ